ncbi:MAG TPA: metallophosphoesterase N-terminal domain-containing protein, partial [Flavisolibacter sp.]|nr:metallophosphoesterase N-terminal domain-containing protein [Flavisolibacter sp.]
MKKIAILLLTLSITSIVMGQSNATGYVFADGNKNGKKDRGENGIAGVGVSNGREVTTTDATGKYSLPVGNDNIIFVIKPSGYDLPVTEKQLPLFYYIHKPGGSPSNTKYKGVAPTGTLPKSIDFALLPAAETKAFTTLIFGDPQPYTAEEVAYYAKGVVAEVAGIKNVAFGMSLGDLVGDSLDLHNPYIDATKAVGIPWFNVMGNHDMNYEAKADSLSDETFESNFGPANYSFNYGDVHFIVLDNIYYPDPRDGKSYWGGFREDQLQFVENDLKLVPKDKLVVVSFHIPLKDDSGEAFNLEHRQRLFNALKDFEHTLSLSAHTHLQRNDFFTAKQGWLRAKPHHEYNAGTTSGDWYSGAFDEKGVPVSTMRDGTPKGYAFIHFIGNSYSIDYKVV